MTVKGGTRPVGAGMKKGQSTKRTRELKEMILKALSKAGGVNYLARQAEESPSAFLSLVGKVLPLQVSGEGGGPVKHTLIIQFGDE